MATKQPPRKPQGSVPASGHQAPATVRTHVGPGAPLGSQDGPFRRGQWVLYGGSKQVGIFVRSVIPGMGEVHLTNDKGETTMVLPVCPTAHLSPARLRDIPAPRRPKSHPRYEP